MALVSPAWINDKWLAQPPPIVLVPAFTSLLLDASADRVTMAGRFLHKDRAAKTVDGVGFDFGTIGKASGSTFKVSLQDVTLATGPPMREDGTPDQTLSIANADAGFASNVWYEAAFDAAATRSLTPGDLIAVVFQFDSFAAGDTVNIRTAAPVSGNLVSQQGLVVANLSGTYALQTAWPNVVFRCTDGSYGTIEDAFVCSALNTHLVNLNTAVADEYALGIQFPMPISVDGLWALHLLTTATDVTEMLLYSGTTALSTITVDHNAVSAASARFNTQPMPPQSLSANTLYRMAVRPTGTNNITLYSFDVAFANHLQCHPGGTVAHLWTRLDQGAWGGEVTTRRLFAGVRLSAFDDGVSAGGGGLIAQSLIAGGS